mgnify:CR=1 FL=1
MRIVSVHEREAMGVLAEITDNEKQKSVLSGKKDCKQGAYASYNLLGTSTKN